MANVISEYKSELVDLLARTTKTDHKRWHDLAENVGATVSKYETMHDEPVINIAASAISVAKAITRLEKIIKSNEIADVETKPNLCQHCNKEVGNEYSVLPLRNNAIIHGECYEGFIANLESEA